MFTGCECKIQGRVDGFLLWEAVPLLTWFWEILGVWFGSGARALRPRSLPSARVGERVEACLSSPCLQPCFSGQAVAG